MTKLKICGIFRDEDVGYINEAMPDYIGFIIDFPKSHRSISPERAAELRKITDPKIKTVGVFVDCPVYKAAETANLGTIGIIQLHGKEDENYISKLRGLTNAEIWKSFVIKSRDDIKKALNSTADKILFDGGLGGGVGFDHSLIEGINRDFILAGGLNEENIAAAVKALHPWAVDVSSGCETNRLKDRRKILSITNIIKEL